MFNSIVDEILERVQKPARYAGGEYNMVEKKAKDVQIRYAFAFPDVYEVGMSHIGLRILYHLFNERQDTWCERVFAPWPDMEKELRDNHVPLFAIESRDELRLFDFVGFTLQYEMSYTNILNMLDMANIPLRSNERTEEDPFIVMGGPCVFNLEPLADICDFAIIGEGEEVNQEVLDYYLEWKDSGDNRLTFLENVAKFEGVYVPSLYTVTYNDDKTVSEVRPIDDTIKATIKKRIIHDLDQAYFPEKLIVPVTEIVHDRIMLEIFRGCTHGCRFCQAGMIYRPVRERSLETLIKLAEALIKETGYEEISISSLSTSDYSELESLVKQLMEKYRDKHLSISLPSLRVDTFKKKYIKELFGGRKTGLTFAPEAGTQRLRDVINKGVTEQDMLDSAIDAFESGWNRLKLYFMIGLPTETEEDLDGIKDLAYKIEDCYYKVDKSIRKGGLRITVSTSTFVPKPFTPFQWVPQDDIETIRLKQQHLRSQIKSRAIRYNWHQAEVSVLEAAFARGDRRLGTVLIKAWELGCKFDGWDDYFDYDKWVQAFNEEGIDMDFYTKRTRSKDEVFPWDHIDAGVNKAFLWNEYQKALDETITPPCSENCSACGIHNFAKGLCQCD